MYRNKLANLTKLAKKLYYQDYFNVNVQNMKNTWKAINDLISHKKSKHKQIHAIKDPRSSNQLTRNTKLIPNIFNKFFTSVGPDLASKLPDPSTHFSSYLQINHNYNSFFFDPTTPSEIESVILSLPNNKSDDSSITTGRYPAKLKIAKVLPVYKNDDDTDLGNYRPISLLSNFNKIFEKVVYKRVNDYLIENNFLFDHQYGFRKAHSTQHSTLDIVSKIQQNMDKKLFSCGIFID